MLGVKCAAVRGGFIGSNRRLWERIKWEEILENFGQRGERLNLILEKPLEVLKVDQGRTSRLTCFPKCFRKLSKNLDNSKITWTPPYSLSLL